MAMSDAFLIVGLGNPGPRYAKNRHNAGYLVTDLLAVRMSGSWRLNRFGRGQVVEGHLNPGHRVILARARGYMNESGGAVASLLRAYKIPIERLVVVHDELDLPFDAVRIKKNGGAGGHNGVRSVMDALGSGEFTRVRLGIGRPPGREDPADFVLRDYDPAQRASLLSQIERAADAVECIVANGVTVSQNVFNT
jgi:peptidyl-tRNA hydrolase, PTH1 family